MDPLPSFQKRFLNQNLDATPCFFDTELNTYQKTGWMRFKICICSLLGMKCYSALSIAEKIKEFIDKRSEGSKETNF